MCEDRDNMERVINRTQFKLSHSSCHLKWIKNHVLFLHIDFPQICSFPVFNSKFKPGLPLFLIGEKTCIICQLNLHMQTFSFTWILLKKCD